MMAGQSNNNNGYESTPTVSGKSSNKQLSAFYQKIKDPKSAPVREHLEK